MSHKRNVWIANMRRLLLWGMVVGTALAAACTSVPHANSQPLSRKKNVQATQASRSRFELGIDIDFYSYKGMNAAKFASADMAYVKSLHANAVAISFPFFMSGPRSSRVFGTPATPSPSELAVVVRAAQARHLRVTIRPLLSEYNLRTPRVKWRPRHAAKWFHHYLRFLLPYARMARKLHVSKLIVGTEFSRFGNSRHWKRLNAGVRKAYQGPLVYDGNGIHGLPSRATLRRARELPAVDSYPATRLRANASQAKINKVLARYGRILPRRIVISEVGIAAQNGAYQAPWRPSWPGEKLNPAIQARWFTGMCDAVARDRLGGIYFWAMNFGQPLNKPPTAQHPSAFVGGPGARAIAACFKRLG